MSKAKERYDKAEVVTDSLLDSLRASPVSAAITVVILVLAIYGLVKLLW